MSRTTELCSRINSAYENEDTDGKFRALKELAEMRVRSKMKPDSEERRQDVIQCCLTACWTGKFAGKSKYSTWVYKVIDNQIHKSIRSLRRARSNAPRGQHGNLDLLPECDRIIASHVFALRERGMTYKEMARELNALRFFKKKTTHGALRKRVSRWFRQMAVDPNDCGWTFGRRNPTPEIETETESVSHT